MYYLQNIINVCKAEVIKDSGSNEITELVYDTRKIVDAQTALFFAVVTNHNDGHYFLQHAYKKGIRNFVVSKRLNVDKLTECNVILVKDTIAALQDLAQYHRSQFKLPIIGITGSNGKTIVKEWLYQLMHHEKNIIRSPRSFNSQIGVPLSVWQINNHHTLGIFEAGISQSGEMHQLEKIIKPTIGIITNIGEAHGENFNSVEEKLNEKLRLFQHCETLVFPGDDELIASSVKEKFKNKKLFSWGRSNESNLIVKAIIKDQKTSRLTLVHQDKNINLLLPFTDDASISNAISCCCILLLYGYNKSVIEERISKLHPVEMRLQLNKGINHCTIINDSYSADLTSLINALNFLQQQAFHQNKTIILSDFIESGKSDEELYNNIAQVLFQYKIDKVLGVGNKIKSYLPVYLNNRISQQYFANTDDIITHFRSSDFRDEVVLIKGARKFEFERVAQLFEQKLHQTLLQINLNAIAHNLKEYRKILKERTKIMAMVKAFAYGSGGAEIAGILQFNNVDYLGVAYVDEGIELRKAGINLPIMVMNADETSFNSLIEHNLQPVIYSFEILKSFQQFLSAQGIKNYPVHIEVETGMNRLGFSHTEIEMLGNFIKENNSIKVESVFSHLAASDDEAQNDFTNKQAEIFQTAATTLQQLLEYNFIKHISNSAGIIRLQHLHMDMVRLGIGLYGIEIATNKLNLQPVATLRSTIAQIKNISAGETVSYNRRGTVNKDAVIATVRIGYADGFSRRYSNGTGKMLVKGKLAPVIGSVCMDMTMIDVTGIKDVNVGDEVVIFGEDLPIEKLAEWAQTIPYEIMTAVSQRVKRIYFHE